MKIKEHAQKLVTVRNAINELKGQADKLQYTKEKIQTEIMAEFKKEGMTAFKTKEKIMISMQISKTLQITDEPTLISHLKKKGLTDYVKERIDGTLFRPFSTQAIKEGVKLPGTELRENEFISVRNPKD